MDVRIALPIYHEKQEYIINHPAKRKVVCGGRRVGKTTMIAKYSVEKFLEGKRVVYGTPVSKQLKAYWGLVKKYLKPLIKSGHIYKNETDKYIRWAHKDDDSEMISAQTAYDANTWRSGHGSILIYDEYAFMHPSTWEVVGIPMLLDTGGEAIFISTPRRKNHFFAHFVRGNDDLDKRWQSFHLTSYDNPHLDQEELAEIVQDMTEDNHKQEILAEFLDNEGAVFRNIAACINAPVTRPADHKGHHLVAGIDWGKHNDYTVISVGCRDCQREVYLDRFNKIDYSFQRERLVIAYNDWSITNGLAETNAMGEPNLEMLQKGGLVIEGFNTTAQSKPILVENLLLTLEREEYQFLNIPIATAEMEAYEMKINKMGRPSYNAPSGVHDDTVIARALMIKAATGYMPAFL